MMATIINEDADPAQIQRTYTRFDNGPSSQLSGLLDGLFPVGHEVDLHNYSFFPMP